MTRTGRSLREAKAVGDHSGAKLRLRLPLLANNVLVAKGRAQVSVAASSGDWSKRIRDMQYPGTRIMKITRWALRAN